MKVGAPQRLVAAAAVLISLNIFTLRPTGAQERQQEKEHEVCAGEFEGKQLTEEQFERLIKTHKEWLSVYSDKFTSPEAQKDPRRANLCGAKLKGVNLKRSDLSWANLSRADLEGADLNSGLLDGANLSQAHLREAKLRAARLREANLREAMLELADLSYAMLWKADLSKAVLFHANLLKATLDDANLTEANLTEAYLRGAELVGTNLSGAKLSDANLSGACFSPVELPRADLIMRARNLSEMTHKGDSQALFQLRKAFKDRGYREQERELTRAIMVAETKHKEWVERMLLYLLFDLTTEWGMNPGRALRLLLAFIPIFMFPYAIALHTKGMNGIWRKWLPDRIRQDLGNSEPDRLHVGLIKAFLIGLQFSVLSAFSIGWREINVGNWIERLQEKEYRLYATGWVRTVSGIQSLLSVYFLAMWVLTYFGRPFE